MSDADDPPHFLERYLREARILEIRDFAPGSGGAHPGKYALLLDGGVLVMVKPVSGSAMADERVCRNEVAAWVVARALGWADMVAATVMREVPSPDDPGHVLAALQVIWPPPLEFLPSLDDLPDEDIWRAAIFDFITGPTDRQNNNYLGRGPRPNLRLALIDHGLSFRLRYGFGVISDFIDSKVGHDVPEDILDRVESFLADDAAQAELRDLLEPGCYAGMFDQARLLLAHGSIPVP